MSHMTDHKGQSDEDRDELGLGPAWALVLATMSELQWVSVLGQGSELQMGSSWGQASELLLADRKDFGLENARERVLVNVMVQELVSALEMQWGQGLGYTRYRCCCEIQSQVYNDNCSCDRIRRCYTETVSCSQDEYRHQVGDHTNVFAVCTGVQVLAL